MEKIRSKGVTIFAWLIIIGSALNILFNKAASGVNPSISVYFYYIISPVSIIIGIFLLKLKNWARVGIIAASILVAVESVTTTPYALNKMSSLERIILIIGILISLGFNGAAIYYFSRPKIQEQFK